MVKFMEEIKDILEYIDIKYNKQLFLDLFNNCKSIEPTRFVETTSVSRALITKENFREDWKEILDHHAKVHEVFDKHATGFNYSDDTGYMPAHIDLAEQRHYNLLLPIYGIAEINVYKTGQKIRYSSEFSPKGINVNFFTKLDPSTIHVATYEKGVEGVVQSCASGSTAVVFHLSKNISP